MIYLTKAGEKVVRERIKLIKHIALDGLVGWRLTDAWDDIAFLRSLLPKRRKA